MLIIETTKYFKPVFYNTGFSRYNIIIGYWNNVLSIFTPGENYPQYIKRNVWDTPLNIQENSGKYYATIVSQIFYFDMKYNDK